MAITNMSLPKTKLLFLSLLLLLITCVGCAAVIPVPGEKRGPITTDVAELGPGSLNIVVTNYKWAYLTGNTHVNISGDVYNDTGFPIQGVILMAILYDQTGSPVAYGETYVRPTYLNVGGVGSFEFTALIKRESGIKATRLVTVARPISGL
jgi:hypothetical protein